MARPGDRTEPSNFVRDPGRLDAVRATGLLDSPVEEAFDRLTRLAAKLTGAPVTFISLVDEDRDFYKSCFGFPEPLASQRELTGTTFCHYALASSAPLVINDTHANPVYHAVPTVASLGVRAYLGVPLVTATGHAIGSFCAIDFQARAWTPLDIEVMQELAASTLREVELRSALRTLDDERRRLDVLLQHVPAGVIFAEAPSGRVVLSNRQAREILGIDLKADDVEGNGNGRALTPDEWPLTRALRGELIRGMELQYTRADGRRIWVRVDAAPVSHADGSVIGSIVAFYDIDDERAIRDENARLYADAQEANRAKDEFFAAVTHELRTPMTSIIGWAKLLGLEPLDHPDAKEAVDAITSSARVQAQLVDDLLDVSRIATGKLKLNREQLELNEVIEDAVRAAQPMADAKNLHVELVTGEPAKFSADRSRIRQIVGNLLSNAIKFTPPGGTIRVESSRVEGLATIKVSDSGRGMDPALLPHIFERYRQATSAEQGGLGLGLTIVKHLAELHGGDVRADSAGTGKGATFTVRLPVDPG